MKKLTYLLFCLSIAAFGQNTLIPDPNFEQALIDLGYDTAPINGSVPTSSISGVTYLDVNFKNISDLTGIEDFTALEFLICYSNQLTSLDVSNNSDLIALSCSVNLLTNLELSNNSNLISLGCDNNQITNLDLSTNIALTQLTCEFNQLTSIDIRNGNNNNIELFLTKNNPDLNCIYVDDASYSTTNWTDIDPVSTFVNDELDCANLANKWFLDLNGTGIHRPENTATGIYSIASGYQSEASGDYSTAMGLGASAAGNLSTAMGSNSAASGDYTTAIGTGNSATGDYSISIGNDNTTAEGEFSLAMGIGTLASGNYSTTMGYYTTASGIYSTSMGANTTASGDYSIASGYQSEASGDYSTAMGNSTAGGEFSVAMGGSTTSGYASIAMGANTTASGMFSFAMGGDGGSNAEGDYSFAFGQSNASGEYSTAMGYSTASGMFSFAMGDGSATGDYSTATGRETIASDYASTVIGHYNLTGISPTSATNFSLDAPAFVIGNGLDFDNRSDAFSILFDGTTNIAGSVTATSFIGDGSQLTNLPTSTGIWQLDSNGTGIYSPENTAIGDYSIASGYQSQATGAYSTAMGSGKANGNYSFAVGGNDTRAEGDFSFAMGEVDNAAEGDFSFAMGNNGNYAYGDRSFAFGLSNAYGDYSFAFGASYAYGDYSTAMGYVSSANGDYSNATGYRTIASDYASNVIGQYNSTGATTTTSATNFSLDAPAFVIGNGLDFDNRSDAFSILFDGTTNIAGSVTAPSFIGDGSQLTNLPNENTDDQAISYDTNTNIVSLEDGGTIDLSGLSNSGTDNQTLSYNTNTNIVSLEDGGTIDLSGLNNSGTDDQQLANFVLSQGSLLSLSIQDGNVVSVDLAPLLTDLENLVADLQIENQEQQALIDDLIIRMEIREECACDPTLGIGDNTLQADKAYLLQNIPNPFDRTTSIGYFVPYTNAKAHIVISTMAGQIVHNIELSNLGVGAISIDSGRMAAAVYLYTLYVDGKRIDTKRMIVE